MKWLITRPGARWYLTTRAPRIAWPITPRGSSAPNSARCQRNGLAEEGEHGGGDHGEADEAGQQPVAVLDHRVGVERRHRAAVALGPVRAAEPGAGQPHSGAGEDDQRQRRQGDQRHLRVELGADAEFGSRSRIARRMMPTAASGRRGGSAALGLRAAALAALGRGAFAAGRFDQVLDQVFEFFRGSAFLRS